MFMGIRSKIVDIKPQAADDEASLGVGTAISDDQHVLDEIDAADVNWDEYVQYEELPAGRGWTAFIVPSLLIVVFAAWTGFFAWTYFAEVRLGIGNDRIVSLITSWAIPSLLLSTLWLLYMRSSSAEANRFGDAANLLRNESEALEVRMRTVNEEIALAREFLAQNARELESVGRQSARQLVEAAEQLGAALADSDDKAKTLEAVSNAATSNLDQLRKHLPVVTSAARDVTNQIGSAGNNAQVQAKTLIAALQRMSEAGKTTREYIDDLETNTAAAGERLESLIAKNVALLSSSTDDAEARTSAMTASLESASEALIGHVTHASGEVERVVSDSGERIDAHLASLQTQIVALAEQSETEDTRITAIIGKITAHIDESAGKLAEIDSQSTDRAAKLAFALTALSDSSQKVGSAMNENHSKADLLIERSERLLLALDTANREIEESLPEAMGRMDARFSESMASLQNAAESAAALDANSDNMLAKLTSLEHMIEVQRNTIEKLMGESDAHFSARHEQADALASALTRTREIIEDMSGDANDRLVSSLLRVRETTKQAAESSRKILDEELVGVAEKLSEQNKALLSEAVDGQISAIGGMMNEAIERNLALSEGATTQIAAQLAAIDEMTANLEKRLAETRQGFDGVDDDSFTRQMALLTESLNSTAIDVAKILSNDVTDTAWAAYLKGDRGVFTRRAVRLLDTGEAKMIAAHYDEDSEFRTHVNRYIHDFEAMMRVLLSTRDGNAIGVTLLSSDVGKLYVALAQAIERLRN